MKWADGRCYVASLVSAPGMTWLRRSGFVAAKQWLLTSSDAAAAQVGHFKDEAMHGVRNPWLPLASKMLLGSIHRPSLCVI